MGANSRSKKKKYVFKWNLLSMGLIGSMLYYRIKYDGIGGFLDMLVIIFTIIIIIFYFGDYV